MADLVTINGLVEIPPKFYFIFIFSFYRFFSELPSTKLTDLFCWYLIDFTLHSFLFTLYRFFSEPTSPKLTGSPDCVLLVKISPYLILLPIFVYSIGTLLPPDCVLRVKIPLTCSVNHPHVKRGHL